MILHDSSSVMASASEGTDDLYFDSIGNRRKLQPGSSYEYPPVPPSGMSMKVQILGSEMNVRMSFLIMIVMNVTDLIFTLYLVINRMVAISIFMRNAK